MISDGTNSIQAAVWDAARQLLQVGDVPYEADIFSHLPAPMQVHVIRDRMRSLAGTECVFDLVGRNLGELSFKSDWCVYSVTRPILSLPRGLHAPLPDSPQNQQPVDGDYADVPAYCASPEHQKTYQGDGFASISATTICPPPMSQHVVCLSSDSEYHSPDSFDLLPSTLWGSPPDEVIGSSDVLSLGAAFAAFGVGGTGESGQSTTAPPDFDYRTSYLEHLQDSIAKAERDILMREMELRDCNEYLEKLRTLYIEVDSM